MQLYRGIIKRAFDITWKSKYLWFFGLFAALLGNGGEYEILFRALLGNFEDSSFSRLKDLVQTDIFSTYSLKNVGDLFVAQPISVIVAILVLVIFLVLFAFAVWLVNISQIVLVDNAFAYVDNKKKSFREALNSSICKFWPVFGLNAISKIITSVFLISIASIVFWSAGLGLKALTAIYIFIVLLFIPIAMSFSFVVKYSIGYSVINSMNFFQAIESGWSLFKKNWLISLEMAFILYFLNIIIALLFVVATLIFIAPFAFLAFLAASSSMTGMFLFIMIIGVGLFFVFLVIAGSLIAIFQISAWTSLFVELVGKGGKSKLVRMFTR